MKVIIMIRKVWQEIKEFIAYVNKGIESKNPYE